MVDFDFFQSHFKRTARSLVSVRIQCYQSEAMIQSATATTQFKSFKLNQVKLKSSSQLLTFKMLIQSSLNFVLYFYPNWLNRICFQAIYKLHVTTNCHTLKLIAPTHLISGIVQF